MSMQAQKSGGGVNSNPFATSTVERSGRSAPRLGSFTSWKDMVPIVQEAGWASGTVWTGMERLVPTVYAIPTYIKYFSANKIKSASD
jgi:hypothetical protein